MSISTDELNNAKIKSVATELFNEGFVVIQNADQELNIDLNSTIDELEKVSKMYSENYVEKKLFRPKEDHNARKGGACMVSNGTPEGAPFIRFGYDHNNLMSLLTFYNAVLNEILGDVTQNSRVLMNWQSYLQGGDNSLPFHCDCEIFEGEWTKQYIDLKRGLIPKYVMVFVTTNDNGGKGLEIMKGNEYMDLDLYAGDLLIFDNTQVLHGVPESCANARSMVGFRNFEAHPLLFSTAPFHDLNGVEEFDNGFLLGSVKELTTKEARKVLRDEGFIYGSY